MFAEAWPVKYLWAAASCGSFNTVDYPTMQHRLGACFGLTAHQLTWCHAEGDDEGVKPKTEYKVISEVQRLRAMIDTITAATNLAPVGSAVVNGHDEVVPNVLFSGVKYPDKLESYYHQHEGPGGVIQYMTGSPSSSALAIACFSVAAGIMPLYSHSSNVWCAERARQIQRSSRMCTSSCLMTTFCWRCAGATAASDLRGAWAVHYDELKQVAVCRSLLHLGYSFYFDADANTWGGFYNGDGLKNNDLVFML
jgi:hypothetical protein